MMFSKNLSIQYAALTLSETMFELSHHFYRISFDLAHWRTTGWQPRRKYLNLIFLVFLIWADIVLQEAE